MFKLLTLDSNVFISETKGDEEYSEKCTKIIGNIGDEMREWKMCERLL